MYNKRTWLNKNTSDSTGSVVCYDGHVTCGDEQLGSMFIEIADCHRKVRLHQTSDDTKRDFINKLKLLNSEIELFIKHLENS